MVTVRVEDWNTYLHLCLECLTPFNLFFRTQTPLQEVFLDVLPIPAPTPRGAHLPPPWYCAQIVLTIPLIQDLNLSSSFLFFDCSLVYLGLSHA